MQRFRWIALQGSSRGLLPPLLLFYFITTSGIPAHAADDPNACRTPVARIVSIQGSIEVLRAPQNDWIKVTRLDTALCEGDRLRTGVLSRAALFIQPETLVRVDQNTNISVSQTAQETLVEFRQEDVLPAAVSAYTCGGGYFITRFPRKFRVKTPHLNAAVEGTEFLVAMRCESTELSVFEGKVLAAGAGATVFPAQSISSGQILTIGGSEPPTVKLLVKPADAVQWVVYYPPLSDAMAETDLPPAEQCRSLPKPLDQTCLTQRAETLLRMGRVEEAKREVDEAVALDPGSGDANALLAIISIARNDKAGAIEAATAATTASPNSSRAWLALSYAQQASFKLEDSLASARKAQTLEPSSSLTNARVAELLLSLGRIKEAEKAARAGVEANPSESRAHTVLGFVHLAQINTKAARADFEAAIERDSSDPLPRLGLGLAIIRTGKLAEGREHLEIAVALDPTNSLLRSYVGKAYYEENTKKRDQLALAQLELAKQLDPNDPTPWFYDALRKQSENLPVEALVDLQRSIELNNSRAIYRSKLLLDQDLASRSADLARIYTELGFSDLAVAEASKSLHLDPSNYSAHRFLSDTYATRPRHEIARASELLQAQLRQPLKPVPIQSEVANDAFFNATPGLGPLEIGINEFNPLFERNRTDLSLYGVSGGNGTRGQQAVATGVSGSAAAGFGYFHYKTDGFRENSDEDKSVWTAYLGAQTTPDSSFQAEFTRITREFGSLISFFDPARIGDASRNVDEINSVRWGGRSAVGSHSEILFSYIAQESNFSATDPFLGEFKLSNDSMKLEIQHVYSMPSATYVSGISGFSGETHEDVFGFLQFDSAPTHFNAYGYGYFFLPNEKLGLQLGIAFDRLNTRDSGLQELVSPKLGAVWVPIPSTTFRAAYFQVLKRRVNSDQGLEPTQVAGFNQFYDDVNGTKSQRTAFAVDSRVTDSLYVGFEASQRDLSIPLTNIDGTIEFLPWKEEEQRAYVHYVMSRFAAASIGITHEVHKRLPGLSGVESFIDLEQFYIPLVLKLFGPGPISTNLSTNYLSQRGTFIDASGVTFDDKEGTWFSDIAVRYRLPKRSGTLSIEGRNIFDKTFRYQSTNPAPIPFALERTWFLRLAMNL